MLIRAQDGKIYNRDHITRIAIKVEEKSGIDSQGFKRRNPKMTGYYVEAFVNAKDVPLTNPVADETEATAVMNRIMRHKDGNLVPHNPVHHRSGLGQIGRAVQEAR